MKDLCPTYDQNGQKQGKTGNFCKKRYFGAIFTQLRLEHARRFSGFLPCPAQKFPTKTTGNFSEHIRELSANNREFTNILKNITYYNSLDFTHKYTNMRQTKGLSVQKEIFFFSNPFGYGPTATMIALLRRFSNLKNIKIYVIANGLCAEILDKTSNITIINIDQRDVTKIKALLQKYKKPYVISSLNRFAILAAKELGLPSCFVDTLTYLWKEIPEDYLKADIYYASDFPNVYNKTKHYKNAFVTPLIIDSKIDITRTGQNKEGILLQLGGMKSPMNDEIPNDYLDIIALGLENATMPITVTGGHDGVSYIKSKIHNKYIECISTKKSDYLKLLQKSDLLITTPGLNSTMEALYHKVPVNFIMPTNLSQWVNYNIFKQLDANGIDTTWESILKTDLNISDLSEYEAIIKINTFAKTVKKSEENLKNFYTYFFKTICNKPDIKSQQNLLKKYGTNGAEFIAKDIIKKWEL